MVVVLDIFHVILSAAKDLIARSLKEHSWLAAMRSFAALKMT
jgi:hypothetical protein